jgi:hypothetical protein
LTSGLLFSDICTSCDNTIKSYDTGIIGIFVGRVCVQFKYIFLLTNNDVIAQELTTSDSEGEYFHVSCQQQQMATGEMKL